MPSDKVDLQTGITSRTSQNWTNYVAQERGFFEEAGLRHTQVVMGDMREGMERLTAGTVPIVTAMADTPLLEIEKGANIRIIGCIVRTALGHIAALPECARIEDLRGRDLAVIDPRSGSTVILREILRRSGLEPGDYGVRHLGGTPSRFEALRRREVAAAFLSPPYDFQAAEEGYQLLADFAEAFPSYPLCINVNAEFADQQPETVVRFLRAMVRASHWIYQEDNRNEAVAILEKNTGVSRRFAEKAYEYIIQQTRGITPNCAVTWDELGAIVRILAESGLCHSSSSRTMRESLDLSYLGRALSAV